MGQIFAVSSKKMLKCTQQNIRTKHLMNSPVISVCDRMKSNRRPVIIIRIIQKTNASRPPDSARVIESPTHTDTYEHVRRTKSEREREGKKSRRNSTCWSVLCTDCRDFISTWVRIQAKPIQYTPRSFHLCDNNSYLCSNTPKRERWILY